MHETCEVCGVTHGLDRHHLLHRKMGGSRDAAVHHEANLLTLCRACHTKVHEGPWRLERTPDAVRVFDRATGRQVMRRLVSPDVDAPMLFHRLGEAEATFADLIEAVPYLTDEHLVAAFGSAVTFGKRAWLVQAAILHEAQARSVYGDRSLEAIARRFEISLRQAEKYALVWKVFFRGSASADEDGEGAAQGDAGESVNIDAIVLDEPSWYVVAASETPDPERWLAYAQDRKLEDPRYTVAAFRHDVRQARAMDGWRPTAPSGSVLPPPRDIWRCPWVRLYCTKSGRPVPVDLCTDCASTNENCETKPTEALP